MASGALCTHGRASARRAIARSGWRKMGHAERGAERFGFGRWTLGAVDRLDESACPRRRNERRTRTSSQRDFGEPRMVTPCSLCRVLRGTGLSRLSSEAISGHHRQRRVGGPYPGDRIWRWPSLRGSRPGEEYVIHLIFEKDDSA